MLKVSCFFVYCTHHLLALLARSTAPGLGYGLCWKSGPEAVESTPVLASPDRSRPADQPPLENRRKHIVLNVMK